jgi:predicted membrane channel-forming protein YqfA (hemolysin III family)
MRSEGKDKILTLLLGGVLGSVGAAFYVWQDHPGPSDAGLPTLSG